MNSVLTAIGKSTALHIAVGVMLAYSIGFSSEPEMPETPSLPVVEAVAIDNQALQQQIKRIADDRKAKLQAEEKRVRDLERRAEKAKNSRRKEESKISDLEKQKKKKLAEKKKADKAAQDAKRKQKKEADKARTLEQQRKKKEQERLDEERKAKEAKDKRESEEKALKESERKRQQAIEQAELERQLEEQLKAEQATRNKRRNKQVLSEVQKYQALIKQTIQSNLIVDDSLKGKSCRLNIRLASNGLVTKVTRLSGDEVLCRAAHTAVLKADTLPVSKEPDVYQKLRDINLTVEPEL